MIALTLHRVCEMEPNRRNSVNAKNSRFGTASHGVYPRGTRQPEGCDTTGINPRGSQELSEETRLRRADSFGSAHFQDRIEENEGVRQRLLDDAKMLHVGKFAEGYLGNACLGEPIAKAARP